MIRKIDLGQIGTERLIFTSDNNFLITSSTVPYSTFGRPALSMFDIKTGAIARNIDGPDDATHFPLANFPRDFVESPNGKFLFLMLHADMTTYVYDTKTWSIVTKFNVAADEISGGLGENEVTLTDVQRTFLGENSDEANAPPEQLIIWDQIKHSYVYFTPIFTGLFSPYTMSVSPGHCMMAFGAFSVHQKVPKTINNPTGYQVWAPPNEAIKVLDLRSQKITNIIGHPVIESLSFDNALPILAVAEEDNTTRLYYLIDQHETFMMMSLHTFNEESYKLSFSPNGKYLAAVGDEQVILYKIGD